MIPGILVPPQSIASLQHTWQLCCHGDPAAALKEATKVLARFVSAADDGSIAVAQFQRAWFHFQLGHPEQGVAANSVALAIWCESGNQVGIAMATAMQAWLLLEAAIADQAVEAAAVALATAEASQDLQAISFAANVAGVVQWYCRHPDRALELCERASEIARSTGCTEALIWWLINVAGIHALLGTNAGRRGDEALRRAETGIAIELNDQAIALADHQGDLWGLHLALCNASEYLIADDPESAREALDRCDELPTSRLGARSVAHLGIQKATLLLRSDAYLQAEPICLQVIEITAENAESRAIAHLHLSQIYEKARNFERALDHLKKHHETLARVSAESTQRRARIANTLCRTQSLQDAMHAAEKRAAMLSDAVLRDPLTNLYNRRVFDTLIPSLIGETGNFAVAMFDLDHFKSINDRFTHTTGDDVLRTVARLFANVSTKPDLAIRMGGEEFCLLFIGRDAASAFETCDVIRCSVAETDWTSLKAGLRVTISIGLAIARRGEDLTQVMRLADERLYLAKTTGRNKVVGEPDGLGGCVTLVA